MLNVRNPGSKPCFICKSTEQTAEVKLADKTFTGVLCKEHLWEQLFPKEGKPKDLNQRKIP